MLVRYAAQLGRTGSADDFRIGAIGLDGEGVRLLLLLNGSVTLVAESTTSALPEPDDEDAVAYIEQRLALFELPEDEGSGCAVISPRRRRPRGSSRAGATAPARCRVLQLPSSLPSRMVRRRRRRGTGSASGFEEAFATIEASDDRRRDPSDATTEPSFGRAALTRFAHALAFTSATPPRWTEAISTEDLAEWTHVEVRALGGPLAARADDALRIGERGTPADDPRPPAALDPLRARPLSREMQV